MNRFKFIFPLLLLCAAVISGCGRSSLRPPDPSERPGVPVPYPEICDGLDNDLDTNIDEDFRDMMGRYVTDQHCGVCNLSCEGAVPHALGTLCRLIGEVPVCAATACEPGFRLSAGGKCIPVDGRLCLPCIEDDDCGGFEGALCRDIGGERRCTYTCELAHQCPSGYDCVDLVCAPPGGSCSCASGQTFDISCNLVTPDGEDCIAVAHCVDGILGECLGREEICDGLDNDCNGDYDEAYRDELGAYSVDDRNCGQCGVDCTESPIPEGDLVCGGDPYHPICHLLCPDTLDGLQVGDQLDADLIIANGCECTLTNAEDRAGPEGASGEDLDVNCDGADGDVRRSFYVAPDGDASNPGSYMYPIASITDAIERAVASLETDIPKPDVYVAAGTYFGSITVPDGIRIHGGYRKDFLHLESDSYITVVIASDAAETPGGAALVIERGGNTETVVEGIRFIGAQPGSAGIPAFGAFIRSPGPNLALRNMEVHSQNTIPGANGSNGAAGNPPTAAAMAGDPPRGAEEDSYHACTYTDENIVFGGYGGTSVCDGTSVSGGRGGDAVCPVFGSFQSAGQAGTGGPSSPGGGPGSGGWDCIGPVTDAMCLTGWVCCGLADFTVPLEYQLAGDGGNGASGSPGNPGTGCDNPLGVLNGEDWTADVATNGDKGGPGGGGGGGGAGGGAEMEWYEVECPYADGLGGGGGGGGAGGCGGNSGTVGESAAPTIGIVISYEWADSPPPLAPAVIFENVTISPGSGARGGRGGAGGDGGEGGLGAEGGDNPLEMRTTPTLAGPTGGGHGGKGGSGGPGGGGGGGCGGSSIGIWALLRGAGDPGIELAASAGCDFNLGEGGEGGSGGGGAAPGGDGAAGILDNVVIQ